ncbi:protein TMED8 isoform X2 [Vidua macroura]|nr:protein TMED8 isoform X2 [Vidua macroura]
MAGRLEQFAWMRRRPVTPLALKHSWAGKRRERRLALCRCRPPAALTRSHAHRVQGHRPGRRRGFPARTGSPAPRTGGSRAAPPTQPHPRRSRSGRGRRTAVPPRPRAQAAALPPLHSPREPGAAASAPSPITTATRLPGTLLPWQPSLPGENEDSAQKTEPADQLVDSMESSTSPSGSPAGAHLRADSTEHSKEEIGTLGNQKVAVLEEKLPDQIQSLKKEAVRLTNYHVPQGVGDIVMIQSDHTGAVDILSAELETADLLGEQRKAQPPPLAAPTMWTTEKMKEFKAKMGKEKNGRMVVKRGEVVTVRVPTHPDGKCICWEFATDDYDIGFGVYFDWTTVTSTAITVQVSESSDEEDEEEDEEIEGLSPVGDVERGSKSYLRNRYGEILPVYRRNSHREVQAGSHEYPGEGIYLLKFDNSYSLLRNKTLFFHVYYTS